MGKAERHKAKGDRHKIKNRHPHSNQLSRPILGLDSAAWGANELGQQPLCLLTACDTAGIVARVYNDNGEPLSLEQRLNFFLDLPRDAISYLYYGNYDITQVLFGLPEEVIRELLATDEEKDRDNRYSNVYVDWNGYRLLYWAGYKFAIARSEPDPKKPGELRTVKNTVRRVYEAAGFHQKKFAVVLKQWHCLTKQERKVVYKDNDHQNIPERHISEILYCNELKCRGLAEVMTKTRDAALMCEDTLRTQGCDFEIWPRWPNEPMGAGSFSKTMLNSINAPRRPVRSKDRIAGKVYLPHLQPAMLADMIERYSMFGGRFEISRTGHISGPIHAYDLNSAYPHAMLTMPCPLHTRWRKVSSRPPRGTVYLAAVQFEHPADNLWCGFPGRQADGSLIFPRCGRGVYWSCEIETAEDYLGAKITPIPFNPDQEPARAAALFDPGNAVETAPTIFVAETRCNCSPLELILPVFAQRARLGKSQGLPLKLGLNGINGKFGQRRGARMHRNPVAFSYVTAYVRASLAKICGQYPDKVIMLATDSIHSTAPLPLDIGSALGQWKASELADLFIVMPGFYWSTDKIAQLKTRGMRADVVQDQIPALTKAWQGFLADYDKAVKTGSRATLARLRPPSVPVNDPIFISAALAQEMERQNRGKLTELMGKWQAPCDGETCDHQFCGRRLISFDWTGKRGNWRMIGNAAQHLPATGDPLQWSFPYDAEKLTILNGARLKYGALPDAQYMVPEPVVEDAEILDDEKAWRSVRGI